MYSSMISNHYIFCICFNVLIDLVLMIRLRKTEGYGAQEKWIGRLLVVGMICSVSDILCIALSPEKSGLLFYLVNCLFYYAFVGSTLLIMNYSQDVLNLHMKNAKAETVLKLIPILLITVAMVSSYWMHSVFYVDAGGTYNRGDLYLLFYVFCCLYIFALVIITVAAWIRRRKIKTKYVNPAIFAFAIVIGTTMQVFIPSIPLSNMGLTMAFILIFVNNQEKIINRNRDERDRILREHNEEQNAQLEEITALNSELEERQSQLEEATSEQEAQIEVITQLNTQLEKAKQDADSANNAKSVFLFNMSHDIRTPMNAILGFTQLIGKSGSLTDQQADYLHKIETSGNYLLSVINNVLDMARIESGKVELDEVFVDLLNEDNKTDTMLESKMMEKNLTYTSSIDVKHRYVYADTSKTKQVTINILSNAIKYTPDGGKIHCDFKEVPCDRDGYARYVTTISDTGIGMSQEFVEKIFDSFTREKTSTENKVVGTGLGMSIVKKLVDLMGGTIEVKSELGKGSTFIITTDFRIVENPELFLNKKNADKSNNLNLEGKRILLAEDNDLNAEIAEIILEETGAAIERAEDGIICVDMIEKADAGYYDLILMDIQMPNMDGYEATQTIRRLPDSDKAGIPIIAMTANAFEEDKKAALSAGMNGHLAKLIDVSALMKALAGMLG